METNNLKPQSFDKRKRGVRARERKRERKRNTKKEREVYLYFIKPLTNCVTQFYH